VRENVVISHRGAAYEIGRGRGFYGIWPAGAPRSQPAQWWPATPAGWSGAWTQFTRLETPSAIVSVSDGPILSLAAGTRAIIAAALLAVGVAFGTGSLFPGYLGGASLASQAPQLVPHLFYLAAWAAAAVLILLGGGRLRTGALLAAGVSVVTFGIFLADLGTAVSGTRTGAGLVLALIGWLACAAGSAVAVWIRPAGPGGEPGAAPRYSLSPAGRLAVLVVAALGAAAAFAPAWDSYTVRAASGQSQSFTAGNAFANPGAVIAGDVIVMVALVAVIAVAALLRPARHGAVLLAGALIPMAAQAVSAIIQAAEPASPALFGISPGQAALAGITVSSGLTAAFWVYCAFLIALVLIGLQMALPRRPALAGTGPAEPGGPGPVAPGRAAAGPAAPDPAAPGPVAPGPAAPPPAGPAG
jgi:hypothetical protein